MANMRLSVQKREVMRTMSETALYAKVCGFMILARLFSEIEKTQPDVVVMDLGLYAKIEGIKTSRMIRSKYNVPVMYV